MVPGEGNDVSSLIPRAGCRSKPMNETDDTPVYTSAAPDWAPLRHFVTADERIAHWAGKRPQPHSPMNS